MATKDARWAWLPRYQGDEVALGLALAMALHAVPLAALVYRAGHPRVVEPEEPPVAKPVVAASLLKLGKPLDPNRLPDRFVPKARTAPKTPDTVASREDPLKRNPLPDGGVPPKETQEADLLNLIAKTEAFAEENSRPKAEEGAADGVDGGQETDRSKVRSGDAYAAQLGAWFHERWQYPTVISQGEANQLCVVFRVSISAKMIIWHVQEQAARPSGNDLFDDSARAMLHKLLDDRTALPEPPLAVADQFRGRSIELVLQGNPHGDGSRCR